METYEANDNSRERVRKTKEMLRLKGVHSPDLAKKYPVKVNRITTVYVKTKERQIQLIKQYSDCKTCVGK